MLGTLATSYPLLPDPDGQVAEIVTSILDKSAQVEALEGALECHDRRMKVSAAVRPHARCGGIRRA